MNRVLNTETKKKIVSAVSLGVKAEKAQAVALDLLIADGFDKPSDYISPKSAGSTVTAEEWELMKVTVTKGFDTDIQALLQKPTNTLEETDKRTKRYWQMQKNSIISAFGTRLKDRLERLNPAPSRKRGLDERIRDNLNDVIKACQKAEDANFDVPDMIARVKAAIEILNRIGHSAKK